MLTQDEAQELHRLLGGPIETARDGYTGPLDVSAVMVPLKDLERARELAALLVADLEPDDGVIEAVVYCGSEPTAPARGNWVLKDHRCECDLPDGHKAAHVCDCGHMWEPAQGICGNNGGVGIGAGHTCQCTRKTGHPRDSERPHGCSCGAMWK
jgi:hypothetical protein